MKTIYITRLLILSAFTWLSYTANSQCIAHFTFQQDICSPKTVIFYAQAENAQSLAWDFGNNSTDSSSFNPVITYATFGYYIVSLTVTYPNGCIYRETKSVEITVKQDSSLIITDHTSVCLGDSVLLQTRGGATDFCWYTREGILNTRNENIFVLPENESVYFFDSRFMGKNLVTNGDFSSGNSGFTTGYNYCNDSLCLLEKYYTVATNPSYFHRDFRGFDHTSANGNLMMFNGAVTPNVTIWSQDIPVVPNTDYTYSMWICTMAGPLAAAQLQFLINGIEVGSQVTAPDTLNTWIQHSVTWNSQSSDRALISAVAKTEYYYGNDFGIDDIYFGIPERILIDSVLVGVNQLPQILLNKSNDIDCLHPASTLSATGAMSYTWSPADSIEVRGSAEAIVRPNQTSTYYVKGTDDKGCKGTSEITVNFSKPVASPIYIPNVFTPNNDGKNDVFRAIFVKPPYKYECKIYDRFGQAVFVSTDFAKGWDGSYKSKPSIFGVYTYAIKIENECGPKMLKGNILLLH